MGGPIATHTFICEAGSCDYNVGVRAQNADGDFDDAFVSVTVTSPATYYTPEQTVCISTSNTFDGDTSCPAGAEQRSTALGINDFDGKRILYRRGEVFDHDVCIGYGQHNILLGSFGNDVDSRPELTKVMNVGVDSRCSDVQLTTAQATAMDHNWLSNVTITELRVPGVSMGISYNHVGLYDLDLNYFDKMSGGFIEMASETNRCRSTDLLDCEVQDYPNGLYLANLTVVGNDYQATPAPEGEPDRGGHGVIIAGYNCPMINWLAMIDTLYWNSLSNQFRLEGGQRLSFSHNEARGYTKGGKDRHTLTLRSCGYADIDVKEAIDTKVGVHTPGEGTIGAPWTRWAVFADNIHGEENATFPGFKLQIAPTSAEKTETIVDAIVERSTFIASVVDNSQDIAVNGSYITVRVNNNYSPDPQNCSDIGPAENPVHGNIDCQGVVPPEPNAPGS
jgi:hypothetical protein